MGLAAGAIAGTLGLVIGVVSGYFGGWIDDLSMRLADIQLAFSPDLKMRQGPNLSLLDRVDVVDNHTVLGGAPRQQWAVWRTPASAGLPN